MVWLGFDKKKRLGEGEENIMAWLKINQSIRGEDGLTSCEK